MFVVDHIHTFHMQCTTIYHFDPIFACFFVQFQYNIQVPGVALCGKLPRNTILCTWQYNKFVSSLKRNIENRIFVFVIKIQWSCTIFVFGLWEGYYAEEGNIHFYDHSVITNEKKKHSFSFFRFWLLRTSSIQMLMALEEAQ